MPERGAVRATATGPGRILIAVYGVFAVAATARAGVQIAERFAEAPLAYTLSAIAGGVYILATVGLYVSIYNLFLSLLQLLAAFSGED